jgi:hypothetical protein
MLATFALPKCMNLTSFIGKSPSSPINSGIMCAAVLSRSRKEESGMVGNIDVKWHHRQQLSGETMESCKGKWPAHSSRYARHAWTPNVRRASASPANANIDKDLFYCDLFRFCSFTLGVTPPYSLPSP